MKPFRLRKLVPMLALAALPAASAPSPAPPPPPAPHAQASINCEEIPEISLMDSAPSYLDPKLVVLTFDDGPEATNTPKILDTLKAEGIHATFFINTVFRGERTPRLLDRPDLQAILRRIVDEGHELGNHTAEHLHLPTLTEAEIEAQIVGVEEAVRTVLGPSAPRLSLVRAPYGEPYWFKRSDPEFMKVAAIVRRHGVHIGWAIDPKDFHCKKDDGDCVLRKVVAKLDAGAHGIVLLHCDESQVAAALPSIIAAMRARGLRFGTTEEVVRARYGASSAEVIDACVARTP